MKSWSTYQSLSIWDTAITEHMPFLKMWKDLVPGSNSLKHNPRTLHGYYESAHPQTAAVCRYYPYKQEITVAGVVIPTVQDILKRHYFPMSLTDENRVDYVAKKMGKPVEDVAKEMFEMRYLRSVCAQQLRMKIAGRRRNVNGSFDMREKEYLLQTTLGAAGINKSMFMEATYDPTVCYSPRYRVTGVIDSVSNRQAKSDLVYLLTDVCLDETIPRARLCDVKGICRGPLSHLEPSIYNMYVVRQSIMAYLLKTEHYVVDQIADGGMHGHTYLGCLLHIHKTSDQTELAHTLEALTLDMTLAKEVLKHYRMTYGANSYMYRRSLLASQYIAISAKSGKKYAPAVNATLEKSAAERRYTSPYWLTRGQVKNFRPFIAVREGQVGVEVFMTLSDSEEPKSVLVYNAEQTSDPVIVARHVEKIRK